MDSFASNEEDDEVDKRARRRKIRVHYDPNCEPLWELGMVFKSVYQFREVVAYYSVKKGVKFHFVQNEKTRVRARYAYVEGKLKLNVHGCYMLVLIRIVEISESKHMCMFISV